MEIVNTDGEYLDKINYRYRTKDGWYFEGFYKRRRNGMRNYVVLCLKPPKNPGMYLTEYKVDKRYGKIDGFIVACNEFKKELEVS